MNSLLQMLFILIAVAIIFGVVQQLTFIDPTFKIIINALVALCALVILFRMFGHLGVLNFHG